MAGSRAAGRGVLLVMGPLCRAATDSAPAAGVHWADRGGGRRLAVMSTHAKRERLLLADLLEAAGPEAPTLCEGWTDP